jgi:hypothetical protein
MLPYDRVTQSILGFSSASKFMVKRVEKLMMWQELDEYVYTKLIGQFEKTLLDQSVKVKENPAMGFHVNPQLDLLSYVLCRRYI